MARQSRFAFSVLLAAGLVLATASLSLAGGSATVGYTAGMEEPPAAGAEHELRFTLLQHGAAPVDSGTAEVVATLPSEGSTLTFAASSLGDGAWAATIVLPTAGDWQLRVVHSQFETPDAVGVVVAAETIAWPAALLAVVGFGLAGVLLVLAAQALVRRRRPLPTPSPESLASHG